MLTIIIALVVVAAFQYFKRTAELEHKEKVKEMEQEEKLFDKFD